MVKKDGHHKMADPRWALKVPTPLLELNLSKFTMFSPCHLDSCSIGLHELYSNVNVVGNIVFFSRLRYFFAMNNCLNFFPFFDCINTNIFSTSAKLQLSIFICFNFNSVNYLVIFSKWVIIERKHTP